MNIYRSATYAMASTPSMYVHNILSSIFIDTLDQAITTITNTLLAAGWTTSGGTYYSQAAPYNSPLQLTLARSPMEWNAQNIMFKFPLFGPLPPGTPPGSIGLGGVTNAFVMGQSWSYTIWASPYAFAMWEFNDINNNGNPSNIIDIYPLNRNLFYTQIYQDGAWANPAHFLICSPERWGLSNFNAYLNSTTLGLLDTDVTAIVNGTSVYWPIWSHYIPGFLDTPHPVQSTNGTTVMVESLFGMCRGPVSGPHTQPANPARIIGWIPDTFIAMDDRPKEEVIVYPSGGTARYICWRTGKWRPSSGDSRPAKGSLYLAIS